MVSSLHDTFRRLLWGGGEAVSLSSVETCCSANQGGGGGGIIPEESSTDELFWTRELHFGACVMCQGFRVYKNTNTKLLNLKMNIIYYRPSRLVLLGPPILLAETPLTRRAFVVLRTKHSIL